MQSGAQTKFELVDNDEIIRIRLSSIEKPYEAFISRINELSLKHSKFFHGLNAMELTLDDEPLFHEIVDKYDQSFCKRLTGEIQLFRC